MCNGSDDECSANDRHNDRLNNNATTNDIIIYIYMNIIGDHRPIRKSTTVTINLIVGIDVCDAMQRGTYYKTTTHAWMMWHAMRHATNSINRIIFRRAVNKGILFQSSSRSRNQRLCQMKMSEAEKGAPVSHRVDTQGWTHLATSRWIPLAMKDNVIYLFECCRCCCSSARPMRENILKITRVLSSFLPISLLSH